MEGDHIKIWHWLTPLSWLYGLGVGLRNTLFDCGVLHSQSFDIPVINVGNITAGGTGKTPHTEYLIRLLSQKLQVAVLSRGYKRKSKGFVLAGDATPMQEIGDEPYQMKLKYPQIRMAVDKDRCHGIQMLSDTALQPQTDVVLLDDAFQHRYVQPGINILLMDYHRLIYFDRLLPAGRLREPKSSSQRADIVIVTKCPSYITPMEEHGIARSLEMQPWQKIFFTTFRYQRLRKFDGEETLPLDDLKQKPLKVVLLTGIASPQQMEYDLKRYCAFTPVHFADHHDFTPSDLRLVEQQMDAASEPGKTTIVITTEKDAARLTASPSALSQRLRSAIYVLPVEVEFLDDRAREFDQTILDYVQKNSRNSTLLRRNEPRKP